MGCVCVRVCVACVRIGTSVRQTTLAAPVFPMPQFDKRSTCRFMLDIPRSLWKEAALGEDMDMGSALGWEVGAALRLGGLVVELVGPRLRHSRKGLEGG